MCLILLTFCIGGGICNFLEAVQKGTQNEKCAPAKKHEIRITTC